MNAIISVGGCNYTSQSSCHLSFFWDGAGVLDQISVEITYKLSDLNFGQMTKFLLGKLMSCISAGDPASSVPADAICCSDTAQIIRFDLYRFIVHQRFIE